MTDFTWASDDPATQRTRALADSIATKAAQAAAMAIDKNGRPIDIATQEDE